MRDLPPVVKTTNVASGENDSWSCSPGVCDPAAFWTYTDTSPAVRTRYWVDDADIRAFDDLSGQRVLLVAADSQLLGPDSDRDLALAPVQRPGRDAQHGAGVEPDGLRALDRSRQQIRDTQEVRRRTRSPGARRDRSGVPNCSMRPSCITTIESAIVIASSWSCVTWTKVMPMSCWIALQLELHLLAELQVERAERLVEQQHARPVDERARQRDPLLLTARELPRLAPP